jgi:hypothetical protein
VYFAAAHEAADDQPERLSFPSGTAAAATLKSLYDENAAVRRCVLLTAAAGVVRYFHGCCTLDS